jgi:hypothetical protein
MDGVGDTRAGDARFLAESGGSGKGAGVARAARGCPAWQDPRQPEGGEADTRSPANHPGLPAVVPAAPVFAEDSE